MTITMPAEAQHDLCNAVCSFTNACQHHTLKDFQHLAGWVNRALNAYPLLHPGLSSLYKKMFHRGSQPFQQLSVSVAISNELRWLANHIDKSDGIHIITSQEWSRSDADETYLSDACPQGMGYWSPKACHGFQCPIPSSTCNGIFFFKALSVLSAFHHVCEHSSSKPSCLAVLTDNSNTFDMLNSLYALPAYNLILITAVDLMISTGIQLRVFHIPHAENQITNALSCLDNATARVLHPGLIIQNFSPPRFTLGATSL
jgi:hypothetical protein